MYTRPVLKIKPTFLDYLLELCSALILLSTIVIIIIHLKYLPNSVPAHFDIHGTANAFGNKHTMFIPLVIAILLYIGLSIVTRYPHIYNYPVRITELNVQHVYRIGIRTIRIVKLLTLSLLLFIMLKIIRGV